MKPFADRRRQPFLTEAYAQSHAAWFKESTALWKNELPHGESEVQRRSSAAWLVADNLFGALVLRYTAGDAIDALRPELAGVVTAYERYQEALEQYEQIPQVSPLGLDQLGDYERCMQLVGLCILLHRPDLLARLAALVDPGYKGEDTLYEDLLSRYLPDRVDLDEWYHDEPYSLLVQAMYVQDKGKASALLAEYCRRWYPAFKYVPWHDGHLRMSGTEGDYFGYWAFEAGAVAYLLDLDDSAIDHMVYPRDMVAWARANKQILEAEKQEAERRQPKRCPAGQPCPREGYWFTPAAFGAGQRFFKHGEIMPEVKSDYGSTIWQWSLSQSPPKR